MAEITLKGNCYLCGQTLSKAAFKNHILSKHGWDEENGQECAVLKVESEEDKNYWLYLDILLTSTLHSLDDFLRDIWLECCGHMSAFFASGNRQVGKSAKIGTFPVGSTLHYEYDFGSTTPLKITVMAHASRPTNRRSVRLLGRNEPYQLVCGVCGRPAKEICCECMWADKSPFLCGECAEAHQHDMMLPVTNSPRMGVCGYCGELDVYAFDPKKIKAESKK